MESGYLTAKGFLKINISNMFLPLKSIVEKLISSPFGEKPLLLASDTCLLTLHQVSVELGHVVRTFICTIEKKN